MDASAAGPAMRGRPEIPPRGAALLALATTAVLTLLSVTDAPADGVIRDAIGAISAGRAGANLARADNGAVLHDNPAAILNIPGESLFELRTDVYQFQVDYRDPENREEELFPLAILPELTYVRRARDARWAWGIGFFTPGGFGTNWHFDNPVLGRNEYESFAALAKLLPAVAFRASEHLSVGASLGLAWGRAKLDAPFFVQTGPLAGTPTIIDLAADAFAPTWSVGLQYDLGKTRIGLAYISATRFDLDGDLSARVFLPGLPVARSDFDLDLDFRWPRSLGLGISRPLGEHHRITTDVVWFDWSDAFDELELELSDASNPLFASFRGDTFPLHWRDSVSFRIGYEYSGFSFGAVRLGYVFHENLVPDSTLSPLIPAHYEHMVSAGLSRRAGPWTWSFAFQVSFAPTRRVSSTGLVGGDFEDSKISGYLYGAFVSLTYSKPGEP